MRYLNMHTHRMGNNGNQLAIVNRFPEEGPCDTWFAIGIHPMFTDKERFERQLEDVRIAASHKNCVAIGECGLDNRSPLTMKKQTEIFESQVAIAKQYGLPVIVHCVGGWQELIHVKKSTEVLMAVHGFAKKPELAQQLIDAGFYLSYGAHLLAKSSNDEALKCTPANRLMLETDGSEADIAFIYNRAAQVREEPESTLLLQISHNFEEFFKKLDIKDGSVEGKNGIAF